MSYQKIADELNKTLGTEIDRRKVGHEPLRQLGDHKIVVRLSPEYQPELTVVIESEDGGEVITEVVETTESEEESDDSSETGDAGVETEEAWDWETE